MSIIIIVIIIIAYFRQLHITFFLNDAVLQLCVDCSPGGGLDWSGGAQPSTAHQGQAGRGRTWPGAPRHSTVNRQTGTAPTGPRTPSHPGGSPVTNDVSGPLCAGASLRGIP